MPDFSSLDAAAAALNALTTQEAAEKGRIDAAVAAALAAMVAPTKRVYLDVVAGLDTNDGSTPQLAVKTPQRAAALGSAGQYLDIVMCSDVTLTAALILPLACGFISDWFEAKGFDDGTPKRKLIVAPTAFAGAGSVAINQVWQGGELILYGVELHVQAVAAGPLGVIGVRSKLLMLDAVVSWDAGMAVPLIQPFLAAEIYFAASSLPSDYPGKVFNGVAAGGNLNSLPGAYRTNLTSA